MNEHTDTPRVDEYVVLRDDNSGMGRTLEFVPATVARQLERENAELREALQSLLDEWGVPSGSVFYTSTMGKARVLLARKAT